MQINQTRKKIIIGFFVIVILGLFWIFARPRRAEAITNKREYPAGTNLDVSIQNNLGKTICFSSCYPYYLQKPAAGNGIWQSYDYANCAKADLTTSCIQDKGFKQFRLLLEDVDSGTNRLMIPVCLGCAVGSEFRQDQIIYSNTFQVR